MQEKIMYRRYKYVSQYNKINGALYKIDYYIWYKTLSICYKIINKKAYQFVKENIKTTFESKRINFKLLLSKLLLCRH